jgi:hypothetical protein
MSAGLAFSEPAAAAALWAWTWSRWSASLFLTVTLMNPQSEEAETLDFPLNNPEKSGRLVIRYNGTRGTSTAN